jgi:hypothetical protein
MPRLKPSRIKRRSSAPAVSECVVPVAHAESPPASRRPQRFGDSRLGESVLAVWQAVTDSIPVPRTNGPRTSVAIFEAALRRACALRVLPESAGLDVCSPPLGPLAA